MMTRYFTLIAVLALPFTVHAQRERLPPRVPSITANAEAVITVEPDQAEIAIGVVTQARSAPDAARENAEKHSRVLAEVKKLLGKDDEVKTAGYSLNPNYRYPQGGKPEIVGYTAANVLHVKTGTLTNVGKLIDASMRSGANSINRLVYNLKDEHAAQLQALRLASVKAKAKAEQMAEALGLKIMRILSVAEGERSVRPIIMPQPRAAQLEARAAAPTPVEAGTIEVRSSVTLTAEVGTK